MSTTTRSRDPLATVGERFALGQPRFGQTLDNAAASTSGARPFGLRFATSPQLTAVIVPPWRYCP